MVSIDKIILSIGALVDIVFECVGRTEVFDKIAVYHLVEHGIQSPSLLAYQREVEIHTILVIGFDISIGMIPCLSASTPPS